MSHDFSRLRKSYMAYKVQFNYLAGMIQDSTDRQLLRECSTDLWRHNDGVIDLMTIVMNKESGD